MAKKKAETWHLAFYVASPLLVPDKDLMRDQKPAWTATIRPVVVGSHPSYYDGDKLQLDKIRNPSDRAEYNGFQCLNGLEIIARAEDRGADGRVIWMQEYRFDVYRVDRDNVFRLAKTIKAIDAQMDKITARDGYTKDFPDFLRRLGEVLKVTAYVRPTSNGGWSYGDNSHQHMTTGDGLNYISHEIRKWQNPEP